MRIIDFFDQGVQLYPNNLAFVEVDPPTGQAPSQFTYNEASSKSHSIASAIRGWGFEQGAHVGILAPNCNLAFLALLGIFRSQSVWLPINPRNAELANIELLQRFNCELLFYHSAYREVAETIRQQVPNIRKIVCLDDGQLDEQLEKYQTPFVMQAQSLDDIFALFPTGGTTGKPKGVMITHRNVQTMYANLWSHFHYQDNDRHLVVAPMTHTAGILGCAHFARGGTNYVMATPIPAAIASAMAKYSISHLFIPPTVLYMLLALPDIRTHDFVGLKHLLIGAAPSSLEKLKEAINVFGPVITEAFGQTEAPATVTAKAPWDYMDEQGNIDEQRLGSIGRPCVFNKVALLDEQGLEVPRGTPGEMCVQGDWVTPGYYQNEEATREVRQFGWHQTGDIGVMAEDGFITIVDRKKDMIISGGFNIYPNEVEQVLTQCSEIQDCSVIGVPDEKWGEAVKAVVQLKPGQSISEAELIAFLKQKLGSVKTPKSIDFVEQLPRSPVGKVLKAELRKQYWQGQSRAVG
jgi:acyl-CoA synthetase (AMP-forming)/AMP-acid ligase II